MLARGPQWLRVAYALVFLTVLPDDVLAQGRAAESKTAHAAMTAAPIAVDGILEEAAWASAAPITGFLQRDPQEGQLASEQTEIRIIYTRNSLYIGIRCVDSDPARVLATELRRDNEFLNDDSVSILLDTLHDRRGAYLFRTNPLGTQYDALVTDEGRLTDANWDESWTSAAKVTDAGWTAEIEIPFKILRLTDDEEQVWGLDVERVIRRKSEFTYWSNYRRGFAFNQVSQAGELRGLRDLSSGLTLRVKPYVRSSVNHVSVSPSSPRTVSVSDIGLEDVKYRITPDFTVDFTINTDFAEADVDAQVLNLTRFPVFFPERREFFVEGGGIFDYGPGGGAASEMKLFFSRRIGLTADRETTPILAGGKLTGKVDGWSIGVLNVQTGEHGATPQRNFSVVRVKKDLFARSNAGFIITNRDSGSPGDPYNRGFGGDANFIFKEHWNIQAFAASTLSPGRNTDNWAGRIRTNWDSDLWFANFEHLVIQRDVNPEMGWLPRRDMKKTKVQFDVKPRPPIRSVRQLFIRANVDYITNQAGELDTRNQDATFESLFQSGDRMFVRYSHQFDRIRNPFGIQGVVVAPGAYKWRTAQLRFTPSPNRSLTGDVTLRRQWGFYGGDNLELTWSPLFKPSANLSLVPAYQFTKLDLPRGRFTSHLINSQINYAFNNRWLTSTTLQYSNLTRLVASNVRLNYIYRPGDDLFVIYNESRTLENGLVVGTLNRSFIVKMTRSVDF